MRKMLPLPPRPPQFVVAKQEDCKDNNNNNVHGAPSSSSFPSDSTHHEHIQSACAHNAAAMIIPLASDLPALLDESTDSLSSEDTMESHQDHCHSRRSKKYVRSERGIIKTKDKKHGRVGISEENFSLLVENCSNAHKMNLALGLLHSTRTEHQQLQSQLQWIRYETAKRQQSLQNVRNQLDTIWQEEQDQEQEEGAEDNDNPNDHTITTPTAAVDRVLQHCLPLKEKLTAAQELDQELTVQLLEAPVSLQRIRTVANTRVHVARVLQDIQRELSASSASHVLARETSSSSLQTKGSHSYRNHAASCKNKKTIRWTDQEPKGEEGGFPTKIILNRSTMGFHFSYCGPIYESPAYEDGLVYVSEASYQALVEVEHVSAEQKENLLRSTADEMERISASKGALKEKIVSNTALLQSVTEELCVLTEILSIVEMDRVKWTKQPEFFKWVKEEVFRITEMLPRDAIKEWEKQYYRRSMAKLRRSEMSKGIQLDEILCQILKEETRLAEAEQLIPVEKRRSATRGMHGNGAPAQQENQENNNMTSKCNEIQE